MRSAVVALLALLMLGCATTPDKNKEDRDQLYQKCIVQGGDFQYDEDDGGDYDFSCTLPEESP